MNEQVRAIPSAATTWHAGETPETSNIAGLLKLEGEARTVTSVHDLQLLIANDARKLMQARQIFVFSVTGGNQFKIAAASGVVTVDRKVPLFQWLERSVARLAADAGVSEMHEFALQAYSDANDETLRSYPMREALWLPIKGRREDVVGGALLVREKPWTEDEHVLAKRLGIAFSHEWYWHAATRKRSPTFVSYWLRATLMAVTLAMIGAIPVSMTTLAPLEVASQEPFLVTAPLDGTIEDIPVAPNSHVQAGQILIKFSDTALRNRLAVAEREVQVAEARVKRTMLVAVSDVQGRHELSIAEAELSVKGAERDYARDLLSRTTVLAKRAGIAVFGEKRELLGKPVGVGERIMEIADPSQVELHIDVSVSDALVLHPGARVKAFLDSDPMHPVEGTVVHADYQAKLHDGNVLSFRTVARLNLGEAPPARLGTRGTAQLFGSRVSLAYYLFRRPISTARQWVGM
jgi:Biotin-lipoyl like/HlyD family secretion protein